MNLAEFLGSSLVGSLYVLDEPSIGLHPRDTRRLIGVLESLRNAGNTVIVVEHEEEIIRAANHIIDIGPYAGTHGGKLMLDGDFQELIRKGDRLTDRYLQGKETLPIQTLRRTWYEFLEI